MTPADHCKTRMFHLFSLISLLLIPRICSKEWDVQYQNPLICALNGSTVVFSSTYKHPKNLTLTDIFWTLSPVIDDEIIDLSVNPDYKGRVKYYHQKMFLSFDLELSEVTLEDEELYCLRIVTNLGQRFIGYPGVKLKVTELRVELPEEVIEKDSAALFCRTTCNLGDKTNFVWFKNGKTISELTGSGVNLSRVSSEDAGLYSCAVGDFISPAVMLHVRYPPKNVSVSINGSSEIAEGDSVSLTCSSDSNPPALNFSWFQENRSSAVGSGQSFIISSFSSNHSGRLYCEAQNKYGSQRSAAVSLTVKESSTSCISITVGVIVSVVLMTVILMVFIWLIRRKQTSQSKELNNRGSQDKTAESPENSYMTLDPTTRCPEYDTLDNMKRSCKVTEDPEDQDSLYYNINIRLSRIIM